MRTDSATISTIAPAIAIVTSTTTAATTTITLVTTCAYCNNTLGLTCCVALSLTVSVAAAAGAAFDDVAVTTNAATAFSVKQQTQLK